MSLRYGWHEIPEWKITIFTSPKVGGRCLRKFLTDNGIAHAYVPFHRLREDYSAYFVIRDPVERFKSLWRHKCRDIGMASSTRRHLFGKSPDELISMIEAGYKNSHVASQAKRLNNYPATLIPLPKLNAWWVEQGYGDLASVQQQYITIKHDNEFSDSVLERVANFYADDVDLYNKTIVP